MPTDYKNGKIYKLWTLESDEIYIGSTTQPLYKRLSKHKKSANTCNSRLLFDRYKDVKIELVEAFPCDNKQELNRREGHFQRLNKEFIVNERIAGRTDKEYNFDNADKISEQHKQYRKDNADKIKEHQRQYNADNADKISEQHKQYYIKNAEKLREKQKQYRANKKASAKI